MKTALSYAASRATAHQTECSVLIHGDAHSGNLLQSLPDITGSEFKFIHPDGITGEPACDLGVIMRDWLDELVGDPLRCGRDRCEYISSLTGVNTNAIWEWGFLQCMAAGLFFMQIANDGRQLLKVVDAWAIGK